MIRQKIYWRIDETSCLDINFGGYYCISRLSDKSEENIVQVHGILGYRVHILQGIAEYSTLKFIQEDLPYLAENIPVQTMSALSFPRLCGG